MPNSSILIVDDDDFYRRLFVHKFQEEKFRVLEASDGQAAWQILQRETPDILFTGIDMPRMGGFELLERIAQDDRYEHMKQFMFSHHGRNKDIEESKKHNLDGFFVAGYVPFDEMILRMERSLETQKSFTLRLSPEALDEESRKALQAIGELLQCASCDKPFVLQLEEDAARPKGFFEARVACPDCEGGKQQ